MGKAIVFDLGPDIYARSSGNIYSLSAWFRPSSLPAAISYTIAHLDSGFTGGLRFGISTTGKLYFYTNAFNLAPGIWETTATVSIGTLYHVLITYDLSSLANDPIIYLDGVAQAITETGAPAGTRFPPVVAPSKMVIGNWWSPLDPVPFSKPFHGKVFDVRVYKSILTAADAVAMYNGGAPSYFAGPRELDHNALIGLVFQGPYCRTDRSSLYIGQNINGVKVRDGIFQCLGTVVNDVIGSAPPEFVPGGAMLKTDGGHLLLMSGGRLMENGRIEG